MCRTTHLLTVRLKVRLVYNAEKEKRGLFCTLGSASESSRRGAKRSRSRPVPPAIGIVQQRLQIDIREQNRLVGGGFIIKGPTLDNDSVFMLPDPDIPESLLIEKESDRAEDVLIVR